MEESNLESPLNHQEVIERPDTLLENTSEKVSFQRSEEESKTWEEIKNSLKDDFVPISGSNDKFSRFNQGVEKGFKFNAEERDDDFSPFHVEILLDQAADLLDRAFKHRSDFDGLWEKFILLRLEVGEYSELDAIHQEEAAANFYEVEARQSTAELAAEGVRKDAFSASTLRTSNILEEYFSPDKVSTLISEASKAARVSGEIPYFMEGQELDKYNYFDPQGYLAPPLPIPIGVESASQVFANAAFTQTDHSVSLQKAVFERDKEVSALSESSLYLHNLSLETKAEWDALNIEFRRRRTLIARKYQDAKAGLSTADGGVLNYMGKASIYSDLFRQDFRDALARLKVVQQGLKNIYGYDVPLPDVTLPLGENDKKYFEQCLLWSRKAISWLIRFSRAEQSLVLPISLKSILGNTAWNTSLSSGTWKIDVPEELFSDLLHVRLRGLSAFVRGTEAKDKLWQMNVKVPTKGQVTHLSGDKIELDQSKIPKCWLARVTDRDAQREPDVFGTSVLFNVSPIGKWTIQVIRSIPSSDNFSKITDIHLDLYLTFRV